MVYYIADMHIWHDNVIGFDGRPFSTMDEMTDTLISRWNQTVSDDDTVYVLGDAFWRNEQQSMDVFHQLKGHKHLILGNHDRIKGRLGRLWESISKYAELQDGTKTVILCHYPIPFYKGQHRGTVMLYGHVHNSREWRLLEKWQAEVRRAGIPSHMINVGCMLPYMDYTPRTLEELLSTSEGQAQDGKEAQ